MNSGTVDVFPFRGAGAKATLSTGRKTDAQKSVACLFSSHYVGKIGLDMIE